MLVIRHYSRSGVVVVGVVVVDVVDVLDVDVGDVVVVVDAVVVDVLLDTVEPDINITMCIIIIKLIVRQAAQ